MITEVGVQVGVEVGVRTTPTSLLFLCTKAFPTIQVGVWWFWGYVYNYIYLRVVKMPSNTVRDA